MRKRFFASVLSVLLLVVMSVLGLAGCGPTTGGDQKAISLDVTAKELTVGESFTLTATTTPANATVTWSTSDEAIVTVNNGTVAAVSVGTATVTATNDTATASCTVTVKAPAAQKHLVIFKNGGTLLRAIEVEEGATPTYSGATPSKAATAQYSYVFSGWSLMDGGDSVDLSSVSISEETTFYAVFTETVRNYNVTWNIDGKTTVASYAYGAVPAYDGVTPTKPTVGFTSYTFKGWATSLSGEVLDALPAVTGEATYYAIFDEVTAQSKFTITWKNGDTLLATDENVDYETKPEYTGDVPTKEATVEHEYVFVGWAASINGEKLETLPDVTADATYYAVFEETARMYTMTWVIEGTEVTSKSAYGTIPVYSGDTPTKPDGEENSWKFSGWALTDGGEKEETLPSVSGEATFYAVFEVDQVFEAPKFVGGKIMYSANSQEAFIPEGFLEAGVTIVSAVVKAEGAADVTAFAEGEWIHEAINLTEEELKENMIGERALEVRLSNGDKYGIDMNVYAGIINELSDFPTFFNNTAVPSETDPETYPAVAPNVYGYYIVTEDLGTGVEELALTQTMDTDFQKTNGFNGVLDGQGHTLRFKLVSGGLVGMILGNAVIKNLAVIYEDGSYDANNKFKTGHGVFGYLAVGYPEIRNCYIERTNELYSRSSVFGIMGRPNNKLIIRNSVIYGFNVKDDCTWWTTIDETTGEVTKANTINADSENVFVIHARGSAASQYMAVNFTKVLVDNIQYGSKDLALSEIEDASKFDDKFWSKENGKLIWKGFETATVTWIKGDETVTEVATKGSVIPYTQTLPQDETTNTQKIQYYWSTALDGEPVSFDEFVTVSEDVTYYFVTKEATRYYTVSWNVEGNVTTTDYEYGQTAAHEDAEKAENDYYRYEFKGWSLSKNGEVVELGEVTTDGIVYYAVFEKIAKKTFITVNEPLMYSTDDNNLFLPTEMNVEIDDSVKLVSTDGAVIYYENGAWVNTFAITDEQRQANEVALFDVVLEKGDNCYVATLKSYAGVIDELSDFPAFFNNDPAATTPDVYGYYIVIKNLGTGEETLTYTQSKLTTKAETNGFNGILDGLGHSLKFTLKSGGLVGYYLGTGTIKNLSIVYTDSTSDDTGDRYALWGIFGHTSNGEATIENCYIERTNAVYNRANVFGLIANPNDKLILNNVVINSNWGTNSPADRISTTSISSKSVNAFIINAHNNAISKLPEGSNWNMTSEFTELSGGTALTSDLSGMDATYWSTKNNKPAWIAAADMTMSVHSVEVRRV